LNARDFALSTLDRTQLPGWRTNQRAVRHSPPGDLRDLALAEQIIIGVVKNLLLLQGYIEYFSSRRLASIDPLVAKILAIALYQMKFLDRIPHSAAVDEAVKQTRRFRRAGAAEFVNAVLRNVERRGWPAEPDERTDPEGYAEKALSHPRELFRRLVGLIGAEKAIAFCRHDNREPPIVVRLGKGVSASALPAVGVEIVPHESEGLVVVRGAKMELLRRWAIEGLGQVQDATAAEVVHHLHLAEGLRVLDRCAGLGTKTLQIWELVGPTGKVVAMDASAFRCAQLKELLKQRGIQNVEVIHAAETKNTEPFDRILVDVPCSNSGVLARRPEARYRDAVNCLTKIQREILEDTVPALAPGGVLVYSTCSVWPEENEELITAFLQRHPELELIAHKTTWPSFDAAEATQYHDGGYLAVLKMKP
jgi:16S rRNA (cytosine967-C5)-methyltransferase